MIKLLGGLLKGRWNDSTVQAVQCRFSSDPGSRSDFLKREMNCRDRNRTRQCPTPAPVGRGESGCKLAKQDHDETGPGLVSLPPPLESLGSLSHRFLQLNCAQSWGLASAYNRHLGCSIPAWWQQERQLRFASRLDIIAEQTCSWLLLYDSWAPFSGGCDSPAHPQPATPSFPCSKSAPKFHNL